MHKVLNPNVVGLLHEVHGPRLVRDVIVDNLANNSEQPFCAIREQLASGRLPNLAQRFSTLAAKRKEVAS